MKLLNEKNSVIFDEIILALDSCDSCKYKVKYPSFFLIEFREEGIHATLNGFMSDLKNEDFINSVAFYYKSRLFVVTEKDIYKPLFSSVFVLSGCEIPIFYCNSGVFYACRFTADVDLSQKQVHVEASCQDNFVEIR
ncbi:MAG: hypothetical protein OEW75_04110 [Cyclobacteriaceae bacterium]|nr:hypothetical protein [Cyclobacteriaceae bacterium]